LPISIFEVRGPQDSGQAAPPLVGPVSQYLLKLAANTTNVSQLQLVLLS